MIRVVLIGAGNVAIHLARAMQQTDKVRLVQHFSRSDRNRHYFPDDITHTSNLRALTEADIYLVAVKDDAIEEIASQLSGKQGLVVHTSGSIPLDALSVTRLHGVMYPIQTFSRDRALDWKAIPLALEASSREAMNLLKALASELSDAIYEVDSARRKKLHLAAVFANNFSNHMFALAAEICQENDLDFDLVKPLIAETGNKVMSVPPEEAQTGPARRRDAIVMKDQQEQLEPGKKEIYNLLSESISSRYPGDKF